MEALGLSHLFDGCYAGRRVLVTGHTGFKGSWLALWLQALGAEVAGLALDPDTEPSHWNLLGLDLAHDARIDLLDAAGVGSVVTDFQPEVIFHLAAQALVRRSYDDPVTTFGTNVSGLLHLFEAVRACPSVRVVVNATTDKVYEARPSICGYSESEPLGAHDPYSTSKACAELVSTCYRRSYFAQGHDRGQRVELATARAGNVIGGGDWARDRLVPDLVRAATRDEPLRLRNPAATRPWQHVLEPLSGYLRIGQLLQTGAVKGDAWNLGPADAATLAVGDVVGRLQHAWPRLRVDHDRGPHPHEATALALDCSKAGWDLGWRPVWDADTALRRTAAWYREFLDGGRIGSRDDLAAYVADARSTGLPWTTGG